MKSASTKIPRDSAILTVSLILVVIIALLVRLAPVFVPYPTLLKEFDPFYFLANVDYIVKNGFASWFTWTDTSVWYPFGRDVATTTYPGMVFTAVLIYYFVNAIGIPASTLATAYYMPVIFGALTPIVVYFLGKEVYDKRSGILAAFFIALSPAIIQRQVAGFFDNDPFGVFLMLASFYFFIRSLKRSSVPSAIMAGLFLGYICISWGTASYVIDMYALFAFVMLLLRRYNMRLFTTYTITMLIGLFIGTLAPRLGIGFLGNGVVLPAIFVLGIMLAYESSKYLAKMKIASKAVKRIARVNPFLLAAILIVGGFITLQITPIGGKFLTVIMPLFRNTQAMILASVGEHQPSGWASFFYYLGIVTVLSIVGVYFSFKRLKDQDIFIVLSTITLVYFSGSMIRIVITLSPILAILAGYGLSNTLKPFAKTISTTKEELIHRKRVKMTPTVGREYSAATFFIIGILLLGYGNTIVSAPPHGSVSLIQQMSPPDILPGGSFPDWLEAMSWLNYETPPGSVVVSWWDYGYYISYVGNRTSVDDNATSNSTQIAWVGLGFMETNESASLHIFKKFNAQYVLVYFGHMQSGLGGDEGKWIWMARIASDSFAAQGLINKTKLFNDTSGEAYPLFFNTTLYRLLFNGEPASESSLGAYLVASMGLAAAQGTSTINFPAVHPNATVLDDLNSYWASYYSSSTSFSSVTTIDSYGPMFFQPVFVSSNHLVKIYKIDYTPLEMEGNLAINSTGTHVYSNGTAIISAMNVGGSDTPPIPFNYYTDSSGRQLSGTLWLNGTQQVFLGTISIWNSTTSSWVSRSDIYSLNPGQSVTFKVTGLDTELLQLAYNSSTSLPMRILAAYDPSIYAAAQISVESS